MAQFKDVRTGETVETNNPTLARAYRRLTERWVEVGGSTVSDVPDGTVAEVLDWAGDDPDRRTRALETEKRGKQRKGILDALG